MNYVHLSRRNIYVLAIATSLIMGLSGNVLAALQDDAPPATYYTLNHRDGLSGNNVAQLQQLPDGRMLVVSNGGIDIYDGLRFAHIDQSKAVRRPLPGYTGATHLYLDTDDRLWVKNWRSVSCYDLQHMRPWDGISDMPENLQDFFVDHEGRHWWVQPGGIRQAPGQRVLEWPSTLGQTLVPQDVETLGDLVYVFFQTGHVAAYGPGPKPLYSIAPYDSVEARNYALTSMVAVGPDSCFYQLRTTPGHGIFLRFDPIRRQWSRLLEADHLLHSLVVLPTGVAYITLPDGYLRYDTRTGARRHYTALRLPDGSLLDTGINAFCLDRTGAIWLGTYNRGLLYTSPYSGLFDTAPLDVPLRPVLSALYLHGELVQPDSLYDGQPLLTTAPPYVRSLTLRHDQNSIAFQFSTANYVQPRATRYRYRIDSGQWLSVTVDSTAGEAYVDNRGALYVPLVDLAPGHYRLEVEASANPDRWAQAERTIVLFDVVPPWWLTAWARWLFAGLALLLCVGVVRVYVVLVRRKAEREAREADLMQRIQRLAERVKQYEDASVRMVLDEDDSSDETGEAEPVLSAQEVDFMDRATQLVEQHMADSDYTVEQLARDLCMERTGLYKRLTSLAELSPVVFIRSIRLRRAAQLIRQGQHTITEVAELTGFGSVSYFSKCFQREFGCKPSAYK